jgi:ferredoxin
MATLITESCINCGACESECPNNAIYEGGATWTIDGLQRPALRDEYFFIVPDKCTECVGFFDDEQCTAVCPVDCCIPDPDISETEGQLIERARRLHSERTFDEPFASRFRSAN